MTFMDRTGMVKRGSVLSCGFVDNIACLGHGTDKNRVIRVFFCLMSKAADPGP